MWGSDAIAKHTLSLSLVFQSASATPDGTPYGFRRVPGAVVALPRSVDLAGSQSYKRPDERGIVDFY